MKKLFYIFLTLLIFGCKPETSTTPETNYLEYSKDVLDYRITPKDSLDKSGLMFSDQGAWFGFGFPDSTDIIEDFSGPFLMTEQNGVWSSSSLLQLELR